MSTNTGDAARAKLPKRTKGAMLLILLCIPAVLIVNEVFFGGRGYYAASLIIIVLCMLPFALMFESRKPQARELVVIAILVALAVAGRAAFFMLPQFKPVVAIIIIAAVALGPESGFVVGALAGFISNFIFGQGPWTPWQMFAFGIIGFLAGVLFYKGMLPSRRVPLCIFGGLATFIIYGLLVDTSSVLMISYELSLSSVLAVYIAGIPFNLIHAFATVVFLFFLSNFMLEKLDRVKVKYGLLAPEGEDDRPAAR